MNKAPEIDFSGNDPFWLKNEGYGLTLYFPAFRPQKSFFQKGCMGGEQLVFGVLSDNVPVKFILKMMEQGRLDFGIRGGYLKPEITPSGRVVIAFRMSDYWFKDDTSNGINKTAWFLTQTAYNEAHGAYREKVKGLWEQAKLAASYFSSPEPDHDPDIVDVEVVPPEQIEA